MLLAGCDSSTKPQEKPAEQKAVVTSESTDRERWAQLYHANFAGDHACMECHELQAEAHRRSGHSHTAVQFHNTKLAKHLAGTLYKDEDRQQTWRFVDRVPQFEVQTRTKNGDDQIPVHWLLGSGIHARTPVSVLDDGERGVEHSWTFYTNTQGLGTTPGHEDFSYSSDEPLTGFGRPLDDEDLKNCLGCHMTWGPPPSGHVDNSALVPNINCERCHGPRKKHVDAAKQGLAETVPPLVALDTPEAELALCSQCHRDESMVRSDAPANELARFQPYGLMKSRCYLKGDGTLTCSTCHDPHDAVEHDQTTYNATCQNCHAESHADTWATRNDKQCVTCHMPSVEWVPGVSFHDHNIRIVQPSVDSLNSDSAK